MLNRRTFLAASAAVMATPKAVFATKTLNIGEASLTTVSDGSLSLPASFLFDGMPKAELESVLQTYNVNAQTIEPECNLALYRDGANIVLFDVGSGHDFMPNAGKLLASLDSVNLSPEDITHVVFTHAHPDHIWGLLDEFDDPLFPDAAYMMGRTEWDYWWNPETVNTIGDARAAFAVGAKRRMEVIEDQVTLIDPDQEILPGISSIATFGHTPGHLAFDVGGKALVVGDAIGNHHVAFHHPDWASGSDQIADAAIASRKMLFDRLVNDQMPLVGFHLPQGGMGRVASKEGAFRFVPEI